MQELIEPVGYADKYVFLPHGFHALATMRKAHGKALDLGDTFAVPHGVKSARKLREMGYSVRSPVDDEYEYPLVKDGVRMQPMAHQRTTTDFMINNPRCFVLNDPGCVDATTEYLTPTGWKRIDAYTEGDQVMQYDPETRQGSFVLPLQYVKYPCAKMYRFKPKYGVDQMLSGEHRMLIHDYKKPTKYRVMSANELVARASETRNRRSLKTVAYSGAACPTSLHHNGGPGIELTDAQLLVQVAVIADGHFPNGNNVCLVRVKKQRKKDRMERLLADAGIAYTKSSIDYPTAKGYSVYRFLAPWKIKEFGPQFWACTKHQLAVITSEVLKWDGSTLCNHNTFYSTLKTSADFVQYAYSVQGHTARMTVDDRKGKPLCYKVHVQEDKMLSKYCGSTGKNITLADTPDGFKYCFEVPTSFLVLRRNGCVFVTGNTGKSLAALWAWHYLFTKKLAGRLLILCPKTIMSVAWMADIAKSMPHISVSFVRGTAEQRRAALTGRADIVIANHDAVKTTPALHECKRITHVVVDEATAYASSLGKDSLRAKSAWKLCANKNTWVMTATPVTQSPVKAYGLCKMVDPLATARAIQEVTGFVGRSSKTAWKEATMRADYMVGGQPRGNMRPTSDAERLVFAALQPAIRFKKSDCLDLPGFVYLDRQIPLSLQQEQFYKQLVKDWVVEDKTKGGKVTAVNAGVKMRKLLQSFQGAVLKEDGTTLELDNSPRIREVLDIIEESPGKTVVFTTFVASNASVKAEIEKVHGPGSVVILNGKATMNERTAAVNAFQDTSPGNKVKALVCHPMVGAHGITLTAASSLVWFGPYERAEYVLQADNRSDRIGQTMKQTIYRLIGEHANGKPTIEADIYHALYNDKIAVEQRILELYENLTNGVR